MAESREVAEMVSRLLRARRPDAEPGWLTALRSAPGRLAIAVRGEPITVEVTTPQCEPLRVAFLSNGSVVCPIDERGEVEARLNGETEAMLGFALGAQTVVEAQLDGSLELPEGEDSGRISRLQDAVAEILRRAAAGPPAALLLFGRRGAGRCRDLLSHGYAVGLLGEKAASLLLVACSIMTPRATATHLSTEPPREEAARIAEGRVSLPTTIPENRAGPAPRTPVRELNSVSPSERVGNASERGPRVEASGGVRSDETWVEVNCDHRLVAVVCGALPPVLDPRAPAQGGAG
jgi:hypothetical protein